MKKISVLLLLAFLFAKVAHSQEDIRNKLNIDPNTHLITYQEVVDEPGSKEKLFNRCVEWLNFFYKNPVGVTKERDLNNGVIRGHFHFPVNDTDTDGNNKLAGQMYYDFRIEFKPDRFRYTLDNFVLKTTTETPAEKWMNKEDPDYNPKWDNYLAQIDDFVRNEWVKSLKQKMKPIKKVEDESW